MGTRFCAQFRQVPPPKQGPTLGEIHRPPGWVRLSARPSVVRPQRADGDRAADHPIGRQHIVR